MACAAQLSPSCWTMSSSQRCLAQYTVSPSKRTSRARASLAATAASQASRASAFSCSRFSAVTALSLVACSERARQPLLLHRQPSRRSIEGALLVPDFVPGAAVRPKPAASPHVPRAPWRAAATGPREGGIRRSAASRLARHVPRVGRVRRVALFNRLGIVHHKIGVTCGGGSPTAFFGSPPGLPKEG